MRSETEVLQVIGSKWGWMLAVGVIMVVLGTIGIGATFSLTLVTVTLFGFLILFGGIVQFIDAIRFRTFKSPLGSILIAILYIACGVIMIGNPMLASAALTLFIAWALIAIGAVRIYVALKMRGLPGWVWTLIGGIAAIVLGVMIINRWPVSGLWVIGMFVAIELLINGWGMIMISLAARKLANRAG